MKYLAFALTVVLVVMAPTARADYGMGMLTGYVIGSSVAGSSCPDTRQYRPYIIHSKRVDTYSFLGIQSLDFVLVLAPVHPGPLEDYPVSEADYKRFKVGERFEVLK